MASCNMAIFWSFYALSKHLLGDREGTTPSTSSASFSNKEQVKPRRQELEISTSATGCVSGIPLIFGHHSYGKTTNTGGLKFC